MTRGLCLKVQSTKRKITPQKDLQSQDQNRLYTDITKHIPKSVISNKNRGRTWLYGYNEKYDVVVISHTGQIGSIININGLKIALPKPPKDIFKRSKVK